MVKENNLQMSYFLAAVGTALGEVLLFPSDQSFLTVIWPGSCSQQDSLVAQRPYTGTPGRRGSNRLLGQDSSGVGRGGASGKPVLGMMTTVIEFLLYARLWAESCNCTISWGPHFTEEEVRLREAKPFV